MRVLLALALPLAACGSSAGGGDCETIGMTHAGSMTAITPDGPFVAERLTVATIGDQLTVTAVGSTSILEGVQPRTISTSVLRGDTTGTYIYGGFPLRITASYNPSVTEASGSALLTPPLLWSRSFPRSSRPSSRFRTLTARADRPAAGSRACSPSRGSPSAPCWRFAPASSGGFGGPG